MDIAIDLTDIRIETDRLILRAFHADDLQDFYDYASVPGVGEAAGWKHHETLEDTQRILAMFIDEKNVFAIVDKAEKKVIGSLGLHDSWANRDDSYAHLPIKEIGYVLSKDYWGRGYMTEAVQAVIAYGFDHLGIEAFTCGHFLSNDRSRRVIEKCGFCFVKQGTYVSEGLNTTIDDREYILFHPSIRAEMACHAE